MSIFSRFGDFMSGFFTKAVPQVEAAFTSTNGILNIIKTFLGSATGQTIEAIIEAFIPGVSVPVFNALNVFFKDFGILQATVTGSPAEVAAKGLNAIANLTGNSKTLALANVASIIGHEASTATGGNTTLQQAIVINQLVHNPNVFSKVPETNYVSGIGQPVEEPIPNAQAS